MICFCKVRLKVLEPTPVRLRIADSDEVRFTQDQYIKIRGGDYDRYAGPYEFTPTEETQTVACAEKLTTDNIIINPIPTNYGRITWNGSVLTVT